MPRTLIPAALALLLVSSLAVPQGSSAPRRRVAVLGFKNLRSDSDSDWVGAVTAEVLTTKLAGLRAVIVVERDQISKVAEEQSFQQTDLVSSGTAVKMGRLLGVESVVLGSFVVAERQVRFNVRVVDVETGEILSADTLGGAQAEVMNLPVRLAEQVVRSLSVRVELAGGQRKVVDSGAPAKLSDEQRKGLARLPTTSAEAYEAYGRGVDLYSKHRWPEAQAEFEKATRLDPSFAQAWLHLGCALNRRGSWAKALECHGKAEALFRAAGDKRDLGWTLHITAVVHMNQGRYDEAMKRYEESLAIKRKLGDDLSVAGTLVGMAIVHKHQGREGEAMKLYEESLAIERRVGSEPGVANTLNNIAILYGERKRYDDAMRLYRESLEIKRRLGNEPGVANTLNNMAALYVGQSRYDEAMKLYKESLAIERKLGNEPGVAMKLNNIALIRESQGRDDEAMKLFEESLATARRLGDKRLVAAALHGMAYLHKKHKEYAKALPLARAAAQIAREMGWRRAKKLDRLVADLEQKVGR